MIIVERVQQVVGAMKVGPECLWNSTLLGPDLLKSCRTFENSWALTLNRPFGVCEVLWERWCPRYCWSPYCWLHPYQCWFHPRILTIESLILLVAGHFKSVPIASQAFSYMLAENLSFIGMPRMLRSCPTALPQRWKSLYRNLGTANSAAQGPAWGGAILLVAPWTFKTSAKIIFIKSKPEQTMIF